MLLQQLLSSREDKRGAEACHPSCYAHKLDGARSASKRCRLTHCQNCPECNEATVSSSIEMKVEHFRTRRPGHKMDSSSKPSTPGCYVLLPSGCPKHNFEARVWTKDNNAAKFHSDDGLAACESRRIQYNMWCGVDDAAIHLFYEMPEDIPKLSHAYENSMHEEGLQQVHPAQAGDLEKTILPSEPGCYVMLPSGCPKRNFEASEWIQDPDADRFNAESSLTACESRRMQYNKWCGVFDAKMHLVEAPLSSNETIEQQAQSGFRDKAAKKAEKAERMWKALGNRHNRAHGEEAKNDPAEEDDLEKRSNKIKDNASAVVGGEDLWNVDMSHYNASQLAHKVVFAFVALFLVLGAAFRFKKNNEEEKIKDDDFDDT